MKPVLAIVLLLAATALPGCADQSSPRGNQLPCDNQLIPRTNGTVVFDQYNRCVPSSHRQVW